MFIFKPTSKTYSDPISATFKPGIPFGRESSKGDICLLHEGIATSKIFLNSNILREAMLNSKEYLEDALGLIITDAREVKKEQVRKPKSENKKTESDNKPKTVEEQEKIAEELTLCE